MATIKLKDVLKSLPIDASLSGGEKLVINDDGENKYIPYSAIKQGLVNDKERATLANTADWLIGHSNLESVDALNTELNAFNADSAQGLHRIKCWGIPFLVTFSVLEVSNKVFMQVIQGSLTFSSDKTKIASINTASNYTIAVRYFAKGKWTEWKTPIPTLQSGVKGESGNYIYSTSGDNTHSVLSGTFKVFQNSGKCYVRHKFWGSTNDYADGQYVTCEFPTVNTSSNGCMEATMLVRLRNTTLKEGTSTKDSVVVSYPNYTDGSSKTLTLSKATTAKAGVMTAADKTTLDILADNARDLGNYPTEEDALNALADLSICANSKIVHAHLTYSDGNMSITMVQSIENDYTRQIIYNKAKVFQRAIFFTDSKRTAIKYKEDWNFLFGDRLAWDSGSNKYVLSLFGNRINEIYTDSIPTASTNNAGLMSAEDKKLLNQIKTKLGL